MKKFKKLFLSAAMLGALCAIGGSLTSHADNDDAVESTLTENFTFREDFDYGDGTLTAGADSNHNYTSAASGYTSVLVQEGEDEYFKVGVENATAASTSSAGVRFAPNGGTGVVLNLTGDNRDAVLKTRFKVTGTTGTDRKFIRLYMAGKNYDIFNIFSNYVYYTINNVANTTCTSYETFNTAISKDTWYELTVVIKDNGDLNEDNTSPDTITAYLNNQYLYTKNFEDGSNYTGQISQLMYWFAAANRTADAWCIDYFGFGEYNAPVASAPEVDSELKASTLFDLTPRITGVDPAYLPSITPGYSVSFTLNDETLTSENSNGMVVYKDADGNEIIGYENGKYIGISAVEDLTATFSFDNDLLEPVSVTFNIAENEEEIPAEDVVLLYAQNNNNTFTLGLNESFDLSKLFKVSPSTATVTDLEFTVSDDTVIGVENGVLTGVAAGTATLTVTALGGEDVSKEITITVVNNDTYDVLNGYAVGDTWSAVTTQALDAYRGKAYGGKTFAAIEAVEDDVFGTALKFTGTGAANASGSYLLMPINSNRSYGTAHFATNGGTYVLSGWVKANVTTGTTGRAEIKLYDYQRYLGSNGSYSYYNGSQDPLYYTNLTINLSDLGDGWYYFETKPICYDPNSVEAAFNGLKLELGVYNTMEGVEFYFSHLTFVEQETTTNGWELIDENWNYIDDTTISVNTGTTYQIYATALPSYGEINAVFSSSDETIATVDSEGLVTFLDKTGEVEIIVTNGDWPSKTITFNVKLVATSVALPDESDTIEISISERYQAIDVVITPADAQSTFTVTVEDGTICAVDFVNGQLQIVPQKIGTTTLTLVADDNADAKLIVTVHIKGYSVTYNANGHGEAPDALVDVTALPVELAELTEEGFIFLGWYLDEDCTQMADAGTAITQDVTLYAKWVEEGHAVYTITFDANGHGEAPDALSDQIIIPATSTLPTLSAEGWTFGGWFLDEDCTQAAIEGHELTADTTLYAKWTEVVVENPDDPGTNTPDDPGTDTPDDPGTDTPDDPGTDTPDDPGTDTPDEPKGKVNVAAIVVPIVVVVVLAAAGVLVYFFVFKKKESSHKE